MTDSEQSCGIPDVASIEVPSVQEMGNLVNQALTSGSTISKWMSSDALQLSGRSPYWNPLIVLHKHDEIKTLIGSGTTAPALDLLPYDCFIKAAHMTQWYTNTLIMWRDSLNGGDHGEHARKQLIDGILGALSTENLSNFVGRLWAYARHGLMEKFCKWASASLWARMLRQTELPPVPDFVQGTDGGHLCYLFENDLWVKLCRLTYSEKMAKNHFNIRTRLMIMLTKDLYMTKNASLPVDSSFVEENLAKHKKIMCEEKKEDPLSEGMERLIVKAIIQCADDIFGLLPTQDEHEVTYKKHGKKITEKKKVPLESKPPSRLPSLGSSVNSGRSAGGAVGDLLRSHGESYLLPEPQAGYLHSYCTHKTRYCDVRTPHDPDLYTEAENSSRKAAFARLSVEAQVVPLLEAFKVRTITKGDCDQYHLARRWQKVVHGIMRKQQNCRLIGQPCNSAYLSQIFGNSPYVDLFDKGAFYVSGDYESATDLLHPFLSEVANEAICQRLRIPLEDQWVLKQCLTGHQLKYSKNGPLHKQQWGQLMGSPSSFPILCLINLAATKVAYEEYFRSIGKLGRNEYCVLGELPMCVNGDDILYWCYSNEHYDTWKEVTKQCGLKFSLGKNYTHKRVAIINSELYFSVKPTNGGDKSHTKAQRQATDAKLFSRAGCLPPNTLFVKTSSCNSRLLIGGQRSGVGSGDYVDLSETTNRDIEILAAELRKGKIQPLKYTGVKFTLKEGTDGELAEVEAQRTSYSKITDEKGQLEFLRDMQRNDTKLRASHLEDYMKWRMTIEARGRKGLEMLAGDNVETSRPAFREVFTETFTRIQLDKLRAYKRCGVGKADNDTPFYIPQSLGGLGLIPPRKHKFTAQEYIELATLEGCPDAAEKYLEKISPRMPKPGFMTALSHEFRLQKDLLEIKAELKEDVDIGLLRFLGEEDGFWEQTFLTGFVTQTNMLVGPEEMGDAYMRTTTLTRSFKNAQLTREKARQFKRGRDLGIWKWVKDEDTRSKRRIEWVKGEECGSNLDFESISIFNTYRPSPKYE
nr:MAG: putative RNA polymerase [Eriocheir sinensis botourmia-like virus 1]